MQCSIHGADRNTKALCDLLDSGWARIGLFLHTEIRVIVGIGPGSVLVIPAGGIVFDKALAANQVLTSRVTLP
jgi:hypothetical protein